jgi:hypothetical protein
MATVKDFVFSGKTTVFGGKIPLDLSRCAYEVSEPGRMTTWRQCTRKPVIEIDGYRFCKAHGEDVNRRLGRKQGGKIRYAAAFEHGEPELLELTVTSETEKIITVADVKALIGDRSYFFDGRQRKDSQYIRIYEFFDSVDEALGYLTRQALEHVNNLSKALERAKKTYEDLMG